VVAFSWRLITVDIDGTLTLTHGWREIAVAFGCLPTFEGINRRFRSREIDGDTQLAGLLDIASGHTVADVEAVLEKTPKLAGIAEGVVRAHGLGAKVALLSHNPAYVVDWYRHSFGFDDGEGVRGPTVTRGRIGPTPPIHADKVEMLGAMLGRLKIPSSRVVHVGDGWADMEVFPKVGRGVALNSSFPEVDAAADLALRTTDFREVVDAISRLGPRE
jgi:phosphoserine phosphatase